MGMPADSGVSPAEPFAETPLFEMPRAEIPPTNGADAFAPPVVQSATNGHGRSPEGDHEPLTEVAATPFTNGHAQTNGHAPTNGAATNGASHEGHGANGNGDRTGQCTAPQLRRFIKSRPYVPMHELRRRFGIVGDDDDVTPVKLEPGWVYVGLPVREGSLLGDLLKAGEIGYELSLDPRTPIVIGVYPMRPIPRS